MPTDPLPPHRQPGLSHCVPIVPIVLTGPGVRRPGPLGSP